MTPRRAGFAVVVVAAALVAFPSVRAHEQAQIRADVRTGADAAFTAAYNLNYDQAMALARRLVAAYPDESAAHRALATIVWMHLLFDRGALTLDHYLGSVSQSNIQMPPAPSDRATVFTTHVERAIALAEAHVGVHRGISMRGTTSAWRTVCALRGWRLSKGRSPRPSRRPRGLLIPMSGCCPERRRVMKRA